MSVHLKFHILQKAKKFQQRDKPKIKAISVNEYFIKLRDSLLFHCRQVCRQHWLQNVSNVSNRKISVKDRQDKFPLIRSFFLK